MKQSMVEQGNTRHVQVKETREIIEVNQKIKALVTLRRIEQYNKLSDYLRKKNEDGKVKRTLYMRNKFQQETTGFGSRRPSGDHSTLSIDTCNNLKKLYEKKVRDKTEKKAKYIEALINFEEDFKSGILDQEYQSLFGQYLSKRPLEELKSPDHADFIKKATHLIKDKMFKAYLKRKNIILPKNGSQPKLQRQNSNTSIKSALSGEEKHHKNHQFHSAHVSPDIAPTIPTSFVYQPRSKFSQRRITSIGKVFSSQVENLDLATKIGNKTRRLNEFIFLKRLKDHRNTTYRSILEANENGKHF